MNELMHMLPILLTIIGALAFTVSVITEVLKRPLSKIPTDLVVTILSITVSVVAFFVYASMYNMAITWYYVVGSIVGGFFVAFVAMFGWDKLTTLFNRFKK